MRTSDRPTMECLRQALRYEAGRLYWLSRPREHFVNRGAWSSWNTRNSGTEAGCIRRSRCGPRCAVMVCGVRLYRYQVVWALHHGEYPSLGIDHIDRDSLNDCIENLRLATHSQNGANCNRSKTNTTGKKGVWFDRRTQRHGACIRCNGVRVYLGFFATAEEAHAAYLSAAEYCFGEFACEG